MCEFLCARDTAVNKTEKNPHPLGLHIAGRSETTCKLSENIHGI
jgi:hypothetical protein